jgi:hypothetical protein
VDLFNSVLIPVPPAILEARVEVDDQGTPKASWIYTGDFGPPAPASGMQSVNVVGLVNGSAPLSAFLPDADPDQRKRATEFGEIPASDTIRRRVSEWFQEQAVLRLGRKEKP